VDGRVITFTEDNHKIQGQGNNNVYNEREAGGVLFPIHEFQRLPRYSSSYISCTIEKRERFFLAPL
jgi:hypothetical protein